LGIAAVVSRTTAFGAILAVHEPTGYRPNFDPKQPLVQSTPMADHPPSEVRLGPGDRERLEDVIRRGWDNQGFPQCFEHAEGDLDPVRELPYRPAAVVLPHRRPDR
jgi:hypothetical protein